MGKRKQNAGAKQEQKKMVLVVRPEFKKMMTVEELAAYEADQAKKS